MKKLAVLLLFFVFILNLYACGIFGSEGIESIEVDKGHSSAFFMDTFEWTDIDLILIKENGERERIQLEESMILNEDRTKLNEVGEHTLHVEYQGFSTRFTIRMLDRLFVEQMRLLHRIEGRTSDFDTWYAQLNDTFNEVDFDEAFMKIDLFGKVFVVENETSVSLGNFFADHKKAFNAYVESYYLSDSDEIMIEIPGNITLNFGEFIVYWETLEPSPYIEYQSRYLNYDRSESEFLYDALMNRLTHDDRFSVHFPEDTIIDYENLYALDKHTTVKVAGIVTDVLANGFIISDYEHAIMVYTFGQTQFRNIEKGSVIKLSGTYMERNESFYIRPTDYTLYLEDVEYTSPVIDVTIQELYDEAMYDVRDFGRTYRVKGGLLLEDGNYYIEEGIFRVELAWLTPETRSQLNPLVGKKIEIEVVLFDFNFVEFSAIFAGDETTLYDTETVEYELNYDIRQIKDTEIITYGYYDYPIELIYEGHNGSTITYTSLDPEYIDDDGTVLQPVLQPTFVRLEGTATLDEKTETFVLDFFIKPLQTRQIASLGHAIQDEGMALVEGVVYHLEHHEDEGVYWTMLYDLTGYLRMRIPDTYDIEMGDHIKVAGMYEHEFDHRGELIDIRYLSESNMAIEIPEINPISVNEFLTMSRYNGLFFHSGMPVYVMGYIKQVGTAYYLYDEILDQRVRIFSENAIDWSEYKDQYVEMKMFVDTVQPVRTLTTLQARELVTLVSDEYLDLRKDYLELNKTVFESFKDSIDLPEVGSHGSTITWESTNPSLVSDEGEILEDVNVITPVTFKVTLENDGHTMTTEIDVTILVVTEIKDLYNSLSYGEAIIEAVVYYIDEYHYVYFTDGTGNIIYYTSYFDGIEIGDTYQLRGTIRYTPGFNAITFDSIKSYSAIDLTIDIPDFEGPYTVNTVRELDPKPFSLLTLRGILYVDDRVYMYDEMTDTKFTIYPGFYLEPYEAYDGELVEIDVLIYQRGDHYEMRIDGGETNIRVLDEPLDRLAYELLYFEKLSLTTFRNSVKLPAQGPLGTEIIEWTSSDTGVFEHDGTLVELPDENTFITFTGKLVYDDIEYAFEVEVQLLVVANTIASYGQFDGVKEVFIEGIIYSEFESAGQSYYFIYDGTGFAIIPDYPNTLNIGDTILIRAYAEYYEGWLFLSVYHDDFEYDTYPNEDYSMPYLGEKTVDDLIDNKDVIGYIVRVEGTLTMANPFEIEISNEDQTYSVGIFHEAGHYFDETDIGKTIKIDVIIADFYFTNKIMTFLHGDGNVEILD